MNCQLLVILLITLHIQSKAQIQGVVLDANDHTPVGYTTISFEGFMQGTISNEEGHFVLPQMKDQGKVYIFLI